MYDLHLFNLSCIDCVFHFMWEVGAKNIVNRITHVYLISIIFSFPKVSDLVLDNKCSIRSRAHFHVPVVMVMQNRVHQHYRSFRHYLQAFLFPGCALPCGAVGGQKKRDSRSALLSNTQVGMWLSSHSSILTIAWLDWMNPFILRS